MRRLADIPLGSYNGVITLVDKDFTFPINLSYLDFLAKIDVENLGYIKTLDKEYEDSTLPTINDLIAKGLAISKHAVETYDIENIKGFMNGCRYTNKTPNFKKIAKEFREHGFNVTIDALEHNFYSWVGDMKSGYRDEENNYHLFTPCGCNPLSFRVTRLHENFNDWQTTYCA